MTHVNFLIHRLLASETQTDRQDKFVIDIYIYIYTYIFKEIFQRYTAPDHNKIYLHKKKC